MIKQFIFTVIAIFAMLMVLVDVASSHFFFSGFALMAIALPACWYGLKAKPSDIELKPVKLDRYL